VSESTPRAAVVVTSISAPNAALHELAEGCSRSGQKFYLIGDVSSPGDFALAGCEFFSIDRQQGSGLRLARECPTRHYARKNLGYLLAIRDGAETIVETDDDNSPQEEFWSPRVRRQHVAVVSHPGWANVYSYFAEEPAWPRGLPLNHVQDKLPEYERCEVREGDCPIQQGLAAENPDVDAIFRLTRPLPLNFPFRRRLALAPGTWCPFNSQNTTFFRDAFALLYLPAYCSFRMTDIWRSFVAQRILWENGGMVLFHEPTVVQERNEHDLMRDFQDEIPGYLHNQRIGEILEALALRQGWEYVGENLLHCYEALIRAEVFPAKELKLVEIWLEDLAGPGESHKR
jgi:hypothetical protein